MKIVSWNVNGLRSLSKGDSWNTFLKETKPDVICLQETKASPDQLHDAVLHPSGYSSFFSSCKTRKGYSGVALYSKKEPRTVIYGMGIPEFDQEGRLIGAEYDDFWLLGVYFPNGGQGAQRVDYKLRYYDAFLQYVETLRKQKPVIFCGDINTAHEEIDLARPEKYADSTGFLPEERAWIDEVVAAGYVDIYRHFYPAKRDVYTYWDLVTFARARNEGWRIDAFFVANEFVKRVKKAEIYPDIYGSDHCPVSITIS